MLGVGGGVGLGVSPLLYWIPTPGQEGEQQQLPEGSARAHTHTPPGAAVTCQLSGGFNAIQKKIPNFEDAVESKSLGKVKIVSTLRKDFSQNYEVNI